MSDRIQTKTAPTTASRRWPLRTVAVAIVGLFLALVLFVAPSLFDGATLSREVSAQVRLTTGLSLTEGGPARFALLPQPHVELTGLHIADPSGSLTIDAVSMTGEVRLLPLLVGRIEMSSVTLDHPRLAIDLDGRPMPADSMIGRALRATDPGNQLGSQRLGVVTLVEGTAVLKSKASPADTTINAINMTVDWRNLEAPATATGTMEFKDIPTDVAAWVAQPSSLLRGDHSPIALRIQSLPLDLSANGDIVSLPKLRFHGRISANAPALSAVLSLAGYDATLPAPFANLTMSSEATVGSGAFDLPGLRLRIDGNEFEGALSYSAKDTRATLAGTLAAEQLSLAPFLNSAPPLLDATRQWAERKLQPTLQDRLDLDLRISASHLRLPPLAIEDAALAVMTRDGRTEITLVDSKGYGGTIKGRASIGARNPGLSLRASASLADIDASALGWDVFGRQIVAGTLTASANLESTGDTSRALMSNLRGWIKARAHDGELSDFDFGHGLRELARQRFDAILPALRGGHTSFDTLTIGVRIADGVAIIEDGSLTGQDATMRLDGSVDIGKRGVDLTAKAAPAGGDGGPTPPGLTLAIKGPFDRPSVAPNLGAAAPSTEQTPKPE